MELLLCRMYICFPFMVPCSSMTMQHTAYSTVSSVQYAKSTPAAVWNAVFSEDRFIWRSDSFEFLSWCLNPGLYHLTVSFLPACVFLFPFSEKCSHCSRNSIALFFSFRFVFCQKELEQRCYNAKTESQNCTYLQYCLKHQNAFRILYIFCG